MKENEKKYWISEEEFKKQNLELYQSLKSVSADNINKKKNNNNNNNNPKKGKKKSFEIIGDTTDKRKSKRIKILNFDKELKDLDLKKARLLEELKRFQK